MSQRRFSTELNFSWYDVDMGVRALGTRILRGGVEDRSLR